MALQVAQFTPFIVLLEASPQKVSAAAIQVGQHDWLYTPSPKPLPCLSQPITGRPLHGNLSPQRSMPGGGRSW